MHEPARPLRHNARESRRGRVWIVLGLLALVAIALGVSRWPQLSGALTPSAQIRLLERADAARAAGRFDGDAGAVALYRAALALDPDDERARASLARVGEDAILAARRALSVRDAAAFNAAIDAAMQSGAAPDAIASLRAQWNGMADESELVAELAAADAARAQGKTWSIDGSVARYRRVLELSPNNAVARARLRDVLAAELVSAGAALDAGRASDAALLVARVDAVMPAHPDLAELQQRLADHTAAPPAESPTGPASVTGATVSPPPVMVGQPDQPIEPVRPASRSQTDAEALATVRSLAASGALIDPVGDNAVDLWIQAVRADARRVADPGWAGAGRELVAALLKAAARADQRDDRSGAAQRIAAAAQIAQRLEDPALISAVRSAGGSSTGDAPFELPAGADERGNPEDDDFGLAVPSTPRDARAVEEMRDRAREAERRGSILTPPGESAFDLWRAVLKADPENDEAREALAALPERARALAEQATERGDLGEALLHFEDFAELDPDGAAFSQTRLQLAQRFAGLAEQRIGQRLLDDAQAALDRASGLEPALSVLPALQARIDAARYGQ